MVKSYDIDFSAPAGWTVAAVVRSIQGSGVLTLRQGAKFTANHVTVLVDYHSDPVALQQAWINASPGTMLGP